MDEQPARRQMTVRYVSSQFTLNRSEGAVIWYPIGIQLAVEAHVIGARLAGIPTDFMLLRRANERTRTADLLITNQLLYQLSYVGSLATQRVNGSIVSDRRLSSPFAGHGGPGYCPSEP